MPLHKIVPGHGPLCDKDEVHKHLSYFEYLEEWIRTKLVSNLSLEEVLKQVDEGPPYPYELKAERRLESTITRWYHYYSGEK